MKIRIADRNPDGRGRGRLARRTVLVSQAHPGELVTLKTDRTTRGTLQGRVGQLLEADPARIAHRCHHEFVCTGCPLLAADPDAEAEFKRLRVAEALTDALGEGAPGEEAAPATPLPRIQPLQRPSALFGYRYYAKRIATWKRGQVLLGSYIQGTHRVADNASCPVLAENLSLFLDEVARRATADRLSVHRKGEEGYEDRNGLRYVIARLSRATGELLATLVTSDETAAAERRLADRLVAGIDEVVGVAVDFEPSRGNALLGGRRVHLAGSDRLTEELAGFSFGIGPSSFFQINPAAAELLIEETLDAAGEGRLAVEGFAGVGTLTLPLARRFERVLAVESSEEAAAELARNAELAGLDGIETVAGRTEEVLPGWLESAGPGGQRPEVAVLDPPRKGLGESLAGALARSSLERIVLLSCDPATLARDLPPLVAGGFRVDHVVPIDPFPRTGHVETVTRLVR